MTLSLMKATTSSKLEASRDAVLLVVLRHAVDSMARLLLLAEADVKADGLRIGRRDAGAGMASAILPSPTPEFAERKKYFLETAKGKTALGSKIYGKIEQKPESVAAGGRRPGHTQLVRLAIYVQSLPTSICAPNCRL